MKIVLRKCLNSIGISPVRERANDLSVYFRAFLCLLWLEILKIGTTEHTENTENTEMHRTKKYFRFSTLLIFAAFAFAHEIDGQTFQREMAFSTGGTVEIVNRYGRVEVMAGAESEKANLTVSAKSAIAEGELNITNRSGRIRIEPNPSNTKNRIDISLTVPERTRVKIETADGEVRVAGNLESVQVKTETGTIATDIPTEDVRYEMLWTESRPRYLSDFELEKVKEKSGGKFAVKGRRRPEGEEEKGRRGDEEAVPPASGGGETARAVPPASAGGENSADKTAKGNGVNSASETSEDEKPKTKDQKLISLNFTTARGIVLLNVPPNEVMSDLRERPLTDAAKAIVRSGDSLLMEAIRRAGPKYFGDYARTLPPIRREPGLTEIKRASETRIPSIKIASLRVTDLKNRAIAGLTKDDFEATESGEPREILASRPTIAPVNLVLLVDVSGSVENYVNFIRKAARAFVETVDARDRVSIIIFNEDVKTLAGFTTDKGKLSESLDTFDAGGGTAYYDAIAYTLTESLRPLRGERTAIVVLSDGDDNRSFLPFDSLVGSIEESGALIYPLYVPSSLIAAAANDPATAVDPLRSRYLSNDLTSKADAEGKRLAQVSGGVYYPITQLSQIQTAYEDIVVQLRTAYDVTFRSEFSTPGNRPSPRLRIKAKQPNTFVQIRSVTTRAETLP